MNAANVGFNNLKKMEGGMTPEEKKARTQTLIDELKDTIGFKEGVDPNLLFIKFGIDVLNARTTKKKPLPQVFDLFAQALAPTANFYFQEAAKKNSSVPAEIEFYSNLKYPESIGGVPVPANLVGKNMFTITAPGMATDQPQSIQKV